MVRTKWIPIYAVMEELHRRVIPKRHFELEPMRLPNFMGKYGLPLMMEQQDRNGNSLRPALGFDAAMAEASWLAATNVIKQISDPKDWQILQGNSKKSGLTAQLIGMAAVDVRQIPFIDASLSTVTDKVNEGSPYQSIVSMFGGASIKVSENAVLREVARLGFDWGTSIEGNPVSPPKRRNVGESARFQKLLLYKTDAELIALKQADALKMCRTYQIKLESRQIGKVLSEVKCQRGLSPNKPFA